VAPALEVDERESVQFYRVARNRLALGRRDGAALDDVPVLALRDDRRATARLLRELDRVTQLAKQPHFEATEDRFDSYFPLSRGRGSGRGNGTELRDRLVIRHEKDLVRIVAIRELEEGPVEREGGEEGRARERAPRGGRLRRLQGLQVAPPEPG